MNDSPTSRPAASRDETPAARRASGEPVSARSSSSESPEPQETPAYPLLEAPADGVPDVITTAAQLKECCAAIRAGHGPVAIDAERASGFRYGNDAYLVQLRREGAGTWLIDPVPLNDLSSLNTAIGSAEWVLHAATQDLPCLKALGLRPRKLFDTELGSRLAGLPRVGLAAVTEHFVGVTLAKEHSAVDWSTRPLPHDWLVYAALDVERLVEVRDALAADLEAQGKAEWARQEFEALLDFEGPTPKKEPWRRTSGLHALRDLRQLARVRALWQTREDIAQRRDTTPGRVLPDALIIDLARRNPHDTSGLVGPPAIRPRVGDGSARRRRPRPAHRGLARYGERWLAALKAADALPNRELPTATQRTSAPPPIRAWHDKNPAAAGRLDDVRYGLQRFSDERRVPVENLVTPDLLRRVIWSPPADTSEDGWRAALSDGGARPWQCDIVAPLLAEAALDHPSR